VLAMESHVCVISGETAVWLLTCMAKWWWLHVDAFLRVDARVGTFVLWKLGYRQ